VVQRHDGAVPGGVGSELGLPAARLINLEVP
jgi:hypothetical protein